jgi:hypothetical protein
MLKDRQSCQEKDEEVPNCGFLYSPIPCSQLRPALLASQAGGTGMILKRGLMSTQSWRLTGIRGEKDRKEGER